MEKSLEALAKEIYNFAVKIGMPLGEEGWKGKRTERNQEVYYGAYYDGRHLHINGVSELSKTYLDMLQDKFPQITGMLLSGFDNGLNITVKIEQQK